jgi:hypothetical protein
MLKSHKRALAEIKICSTTSSEGNRRARQAKTDIEESRGATEGGKREPQDEPREAGKLGANAHKTAILSGRIVEISI